MISVESELGAFERICDRLIYEWYSGINALSRFRVSSRKLTSTWRESYSFLFGIISFRFYYVFNNAGIGLSIRFVLLRKFC